MHGGLKPKSLLELVGIARRFEQGSARLTARLTFSAFQEKGFRRRGSDAFVANLFLAGGLRHQFPTCSTAVENLHSPQHDDDGRYQRGRRQYTF